MITDEIRERRRDYICSSDIAGIWGVSPFSTPYDIWMEKVYKIEDYTNKSMESGNDNEKYIVMDVCQHFGFDYSKVEIKPDKLWKTSEKYPLFAVNLDADMPGIEVKLTTESHDWGIWEDQTIPQHFYMQNQLQMLVTGYEIIYVGVWIVMYGIDKRFYEIKRDEKVISEILNLAPKWWNRYVLPAREEIARNETPSLIPKMTKPAYDRYRRVITKPNTIKCVGRELWKEWEKAKEELKNATRNEKMIKSQVMEIKGDSEALKTPDGDYYMKDRGGRLRVIKKERIEGYE